MSELIPVQDLESLTEALGAFVALDFFDDNQPRLVGKIESADYLEGEWSIIVVEADKGLEGINLIEVREIRGAYWAPAGYRANG